MSFFLLLYFNLVVGIIIGVACLVVPQVPFAHAALWLYHMYRPRTVPGKGSSELFNYSGKGRFMNVFVGILFCMGSLAVLQVWLHMQRCGSMTCIVCAQHLR